jgi:hypothetical protein
MGTSTPLMRFRTPSATSATKSGIPRFAFPGTFRPWVFSTLRRFTPSQHSLSYFVQAPPMGFKELWPWLRTATNVDSAHETSKRCTSRAFSAGVAPDEENFRKLASKPSFVPQTFLLLVSAAGVWTAFLPLSCHSSTDPPKRAVAERTLQRRWITFQSHPLQFAAAKQPEEPPSRQSNAVNGEP